VEIPEVMHRARNSILRPERLAAHFLLAFAAILICSTDSPGRQAVRKSASRQTTTVDPRLQDVQQLLSQDRVEEAKQKIQELLRQNPKSAEGYDMLGILYTRQKDYENALDAFRHALKLNPNSVGAHNNLGNIYVAQEQLDLAEKEFRETLRIEPGNSGGNYNLGLVLLAKNEPSEAIQRFLLVKPATAESRFNLARAYLRASRTAQGLQVAAAISSQDPESVRLHLALGLLLASEKQYRAAQLELEKANSLQPDTFEILCNLGQVYLHSAEYSKAELVLKRAQNLMPDSSEILYFLAQVYADQARVVDALELLVRAHKLAPENTDIIFLLARLSMTQNYFEDAIPLLESGIKIAPRRADLHAALGESFFMSGKADKAINEFKQLIDLDPAARSYAFMGLSYRHLGRFDEARKYFAEGLKLDSNNASCLFNMGFIEGRQGNQGKAEEYFQKTLRAHPDFSEALLELANLRISAKRYAEAAGLLRRYVKVSRDPAPGYYKLAMVERNLKQFAAAQRDLSVFQTLSRNASAGPYPYQHLFDYLDNRAHLTAQERTQLDLTELTEQIKKHPERPQDFYLLAEAYLKLGKTDDAQKTIAQLDQMSAEDFRMQAGIGVLLARFRFYDDAIHHFRTALHASPDSDDVKFDLADAYFRKGQYQPALEIANQVSADAQKDDAYLALLGDIYVHLSDSAKSAEIFKGAIARNPDNDQYYLSLALVQLRGGDVDAADETLSKGLNRVPSSGKILWGLGIISALRGNSAQAAERLERAVDLLPEWSGSYSTLGVFYYQTGQYAKAREVLDRFKGSQSSAGLDVGRIEQALANAPRTSTATLQPLPMAARQQLLQVAFSLADRTL